MRRIIVEAEKCSGCRACEILCSYVHTGSFRPSASRITVSKDDAIGMDYPIMCHQCDHCTASLVCSVDALTKGPDGKINVNVDVCTGCGACAKACKYDAVKMRDGLPLVCDLCNGSPICVTRCPTKALSFVEGAIEPEDAEEEHRKLMVRWGMIA